ncbi:MAG: EAL domain-containing protein [Burkholderiales bacterium]|nr:EAL domain-containing protein [Burkholderiales bacterium]
MNIVPPRDSEASGCLGELDEKSRELNKPGEPCDTPHREISRKECEQHYEEVRDLRAEVARLRALALGASAESAHAREAEARASADVEDRVNQLREANEHLVVATLRAQDMTEVVEQVKLDLSHLAHHDFLTGLPNRMMLNDRLGQAIALARRHGKQLAVLFLDLDHFKHINDSLGHSIGDKLLQSVAQCLAACVRGSDTVSRMGGDEFVVLLSEIGHAEDAAFSAEKMLSALTAPHAIAGHDLHVSSSIGISVYPDDGGDAETLIRNADTAMYAAKEAGRNNSQFFRQDMNIRAVERQSLEGSLRRALERHEFVLHYQPKVNLRTGMITGVEALIRWLHPQRGLIPPAQFIPIAEDSGLIVPIGRWVLGEACRQAQAWMDTGREAMTMSVNISAIEFRSSGFLESVRAILRETGISPNRLELELTESVLMQEAGSAAALLEELKAMGVQLAVDDFGTGYSSLSYLKRFPIDVLKIDQSFVKDMTTDPDDAVIVAAIIGMGKSLKQRVIAEGVETREQLVLLQASQCGEGQGFYFSRPLTAEQFTVEVGTDITTAVIH